MGMISVSIQSHLHDILFYTYVTPITMPKMQVNLYTRCVVNFKVYMHAHQSDCVPRIVPEAAHIYIQILQPPMLTSLFQMAIPLPII